MTVKQIYGLILGLALSGCSQADKNQGHLKDQSSGAVDVMEVSDIYSIDTRINDDCGSAGLALSGLDCRLKDSMLKVVTESAGVLSVGTLVCSLFQPEAAPLLIAAFKYQGQAFGALAFVLNEMPCQESLSPDQLKQVNDLITKKMQDSGIQVNQSFAISPTVSQHP